MILQLYCVFDAKLGEYLPPFHSANDSTARRQFERAVSNEGHDFNMHAEDYSLWGIANFDTEKAIITTYEPQAVAQAHQLLAHIRKMEAQRAWADTELTDEQKNRGKA